jgi:hypothetical protein
VGAAVGVHPAKHSRLTAEMLALHGRVELQALAKEVGRRRVIDSTSR